MKYYTDPKFGKITIIRSHASRHISVHITINGELRVCAPYFVNLNLIKYTLKKSSCELDNLILKNIPPINPKPGMKIGKGHYLIVKESSSIFKTEIKENCLIIYRPINYDLNDPLAQKVIKNSIVKIYRIEAKNYLPKRLQFIAKQYGLAYNKIHLSHGSSRWGSCSSAGTISLNISLMKLPNELIDYVIKHELAHTIEMNHGQNFWKIVGSLDENYKLHQKQLKEQTPFV